MKALLIDDEPFALKLLARQLANLGVTELTCHESANEALSALQQDAATADLVFCDLQMPEMDGVELVRHLARIDYGGALVLVSGEDERILKTAGNLAQAHRLNVLGTLRKPVLPDQLRQILDGQISRVAEAGRGARKTYSASELRRAIDGGELVNHYQPKVDLRSRSVVGVETLVRWQHPQDGLVFPDQFIATAEQAGLINDLTRVVLSGALAQAGVWHAAGLALSLAVNVSMDNLGALEFPDWVADAAGKAGVPLASVILEVTESQLMRDPLAALDILTRLRLKRIGLSIDDFGTGYSSLAQLRDIPFDELKIDRGFVHGARNDASLRAIFEASLGMARQLDLKTVAEGVEDIDDWNFLRQSDCTSAQGYFVARPMPATDLPEWISGWGARLPEFEANA